jgi:hypothetical protein
MMAKIPGPNGSGFGLPTAPSAHHGRGLGLGDQMKLDRVHGKMTAQAAFEKYLKGWKAQKA